MLDPDKKGPFVIGFNGPPRSGKDTLATALKNLLSQTNPDIPVHCKALAETMRNGAMAILGLTGGDKYYSEIKDKPLELLDGKTFRQFMIDMSEVFVKQQYGQDFWSRLLYARNQSWWHISPSILLVTDIGFSAEVEFLCKHSSHYIGVMLTRGDLDFSNDSRGYCPAQTRGGVDFAYDNCGTPEDGAEEILRIMWQNGWPVL